MNATATTPKHFLGKASTTAPRYDANIGIAALVLIAGICLAQDLWAADVGRLFFDPAQRAELDRLRRQPPKPAPRPAAAAPVIQAEPIKDVTLNGYVTRSNGRSTVWINNAPANARPGLGTATPLPVPLGETGKQVPLKVGQSYGETSGTRDLIGGGIIEVKP